MFEMAAHAIPAVWILHAELCVVAPVRGQAAGDFLMAFKALKGWGAGPELVATAALRGTVERLVGFGKRAGRNLGMRRWNGAARCREKKQRK